MAAIMNGIALHGGFIPYGGTFLTFSDYSRNAIRMAALMKQRVDPRLHARLDRPRRGRPDAPVDRARGVAAPDPEPRRLAAVRHRRDRGRVGARRSRAATRPSALLLSRQNLPYAPKPASTRAPKALATSPRAPTCSPSRARSACTRKAAGRDHRHRLGGAARAERAAAARRPSTAASRCASSRCRRRRCSTARSDAYKRSVLPPGVPRIAVEMGVTRRLVEVRLRRGRRHRHATANRRRRRCCSSTSASRSRTSSRRCKAALERALIPSSTSRSTFHDHQDRHQRLRPHRTHGVSRRRAELSATSRSSASTTCSSPTTSPTCCSTTRCTAASRATSRSTATRWSSTASGSA